MIKEVYGNILWSKSDAIVQGIAPNEDFSRGLAASIKEEWPAIASDFDDCCCQGSMTLGDIWAWDNQHGLDVVNLVIHGEANQASVASVDKALSALADLVAQRGIKSLAVTKIGTDVGGLDWREVKPLIEKHLGQLNIPIYLYTIFHKAIAAVEE